MAAILTASSGPSYAPEDPTLPKPWKGLVDGSTGYIYFWNPETNDTQYERPVPSSNEVPAPAHKSAVFVNSSGQKPSQGQHCDPDGRYSRGSNNMVTSLKGDQNARSCSDYSRDHEDYGSIVVGNDISQESYCRHNEISVMGSNVPAPLTSFEASGFPSEIVREVRYLLQGGAKCRTLFNHLLGDSIYVEHPYLVDQII